MKFSAKTVVLFICALFCFAFLACGGGGGGGGGGASGSSSSPWGGGGSQEVVVNASGLSSIDFGTTDAPAGGAGDGGAEAPAGGVPAGDGAPAATPVPVTWKTFELHFFVNGVESVYNLTPSNPSVSIPNVPSGSTVYAYADITLSGGIKPNRRATSDTITVEKGHNQVTLYIPYYYTIIDDDTDNTVVDSTEYTAKGGINLPTQIGDIDYGSYICSNGTSYNPGVCTGIKGDVTFTAFPVPAPGTITGTVDTSGVLTSVNLTNMTDDGKIVIPVKIDGNAITTLPADLFTNNTDIKEVVIKANVTQIGNSAFNGCTNLTSITLPDSLTAIGDSVFRGCTNLTSVTLPDSLTTIGDSVFRGCTNLTSVTLPDSLTTIGSGAFRGCENLTSVTLPDSLTTIGDSVFRGCTNLTSVTLPDSLTTIGSSAFNFCKKITSITLPDSLTTIGSGAFNNLAITSINIPDGVTTLEEGTFENCHNLTEINTNNVTSIKSDCFCDCENLTKVEMPNVTSFSEFAFEDADNITSLVFGKPTVTALDDTASDYILGCKNGLTITVPSGADSSVWDAIKSKFTVTGVTISYTL